jgi:hypothetical protein
MVLLLLICCKWSMGLQDLRDFERVNLLFLIAMGDKFPVEIKLVIKQDRALWDSATNALSINLISPKIEARQGLGSPL